MSCTDDAEVSDEDDTTHEIYPPNLPEDRLAAENDKILQYPASAPTASPAHATSTPYVLNKLRTCEKKTDLYILQPERLNTSGQSNPLKGKLTNCHVTGCERYITDKSMFLFMLRTLTCWYAKLSILPHFLLIM